MTTQPPATTIEEISSTTTGTEEHLFREIKKQKNLTTISNSHILNVLFRFKNRQLRRPQLLCVLGYTCQTNARKRSFATKC